MIWIFLIVVIVLVILMATKSTGNKIKPGQIEIQVSMPNPKTCSYDSFKEFVDKTTPVELEAVLKEIDNQGVYLKTSFRQLVENKIKQPYPDEDIVPPVTELDDNLIEVTSEKLSEAENNSNDYINEHIVPLVTELDDNLIEVTSEKLSEAENNINDNTNEDIFKDPNR